MTHAPYGLPSTVVSSPVRRQLSTPQQPTLVYSRPASPPLCPKPSLAKAGVHTEQDTVHDSNTCRGIDSTVIAIPLRWHHTFTLGSLVLLACQPGLRIVYAWWTRGGSTGVEMVKSYLRYRPGPVHGLITQPNCNIATDANGRIVLTGECEHVGIWNIRTGAQVSKLFASQVGTRPGMANRTEPHSLCRSMFSLYQAMILRHDQMCLM